MMRYIKTTFPDINNGSGVRVTLWLPGCIHKCPGCQNSWAADYKIGQEFDETAKTYIKELLSRPYVAGLTLSGGDPLAQTDETLTELRSFLQEIKAEFPTKNIWLYTGFYYDDLDNRQLSVLEYVDVIVDGPFKIDMMDRSLPFMGSSNQHIIELHK